MVNIIKAFEFVHPIEKKVGGAWTTTAIICKGKASFECTAPHPLVAGYYRLNLSNGRLLIVIEFTSIIDVLDNQDRLAMLQLNNELIEELRHKAEHHVRIRLTK